MEKSEILDLGVRLMKRHKLKGWRFGFDYAKKRLGYCQYNKKKITLSNHFIKIQTKKSIKLTILHEIAHALVGPHHGHDRVWQQKCIEIGGDGKRLAVDNEYKRGTSSRETMYKKTAKWKAVCPKCGHIEYFHRKPKRQYCCIFDGSILTLKEIHRRKRKYEKTI